MTIQRKPSVKCERLIPSILILQMKKLPSILIIAMLSRKINCKKNSSLISSKKIEEPKIKTQCLHKLKILLLKDKATESRIQPFSLKQVLKTYEGHESSLLKLVTIKELKQEVNQLKVKIRELKNYIERQSLVEESNSILISQPQELENRVSSLKTSNLLINLLYLLLN